VKRLWAVRRIGFLLDQIQPNGRPAEVVEELVQLSRQYGIITPCTGFLADEQADWSNRMAILGAAKTAAMGLVSNWKRSRRSDERIESRHNEQRQCCSGPVDRGQGVGPDRPEQSPKLSSERD
jgi:hypothetical protein